MNYDRMPSSSVTARLPLPSVLPSRSAKKGSTTTILKPRPRAEHAIMPSSVRAQDTVACILQAAERVLGDVGWERFSTNRVAKVAGVSIGALYRYFPNREQLVRSLILSLWTSELCMMTQALIGSTSLDLVVFDYAEHVRQRIPLYREWYTFAVQFTSPDAGQWDARAVECLVGIFDAHYLDDPRKQRACELIYVTVVHALRRAAGVDPQSLEDGSLARELATLVRVYLATFVPRTDTVIPSCPTET